MILLKTREIKPNLKCIVTNHSDAIRNEFNTTNSMRVAPWLPPLTNFEVRKTFFGHPRFIYTCPICNEQKEFTSEELRDQLPEPDNLIFDYVLSTLALKRVLRFNKFSDVALKFVMTLTAILLVNELVEFYFKYFYE